MNRLEQREHYLIMEIFNNQLYRDNMNISLEKQAEIESIIDELWEELEEVRRWKTSKLYRTMYETN